MLVVPSRGRRRVPCAAWFGVAPSCPEQGGVPRTVAGPHGLSVALRMECRLGGKRRRVNSARNLIAFGRPTASMRRRPEVTVWRLRQTLAVFGAGVRRRVVDLSRRAVRKPLMSRLRGTVECGPRRSSVCPGRAWAARRATSENVSPWAVVGPLVGVQPREVSAVGPFMPETPSYSVASLQVCAADQG